MVAKFHTYGASAAGYRRNVSEYEGFLIFAYLRATERARENNRFSVLKTRAADKEKGHSAAGEIRHVETRFIASLTAHMASVRRDREARAPIGGELSITVGEPKANLRKGSIRICGPHGGPTRRHTRGAARLPSVQRSSRRSPRSARRRREVRPLWGRSGVWFLSAGGFAHPRL